jgi:uncharacterized cofD-like protein
MAGDLIVCIGAGTGVGSVVAGLKRLSMRFAAIINVTDNGGSSGQIRRSLGMPQPGDSRNVLGSAGRANSVLADLFRFRFDRGEFAGTSLGNLILAALNEIEGNFDRAVQAAARLLSVPGQVIPSTTWDTQVCAELENGSTVEGEWDIIGRDDPSPIRTVFLKDNAPTTPRALHAVEEARAIAIGPGSLWTGVIPPLLTAGMKDAIQSSDACLAYICNLMTQPGLTDNYSASDHVHAIEQYTGRPVDFVIANERPIAREVLDHYHAIGSEPVDVDAANLKGRLITGDLAADSEAVQRAARDVRVGSAQGEDFKKMSKWTHLLRHDSEEIALTLARLCDEPR